MTCEDWFYFLVLEKQADVHVRSKDEVKERERRERRDTGTAAKTNMNRCGGRFTQLTPEIKGALH